MYYYTIVMTLIGSHVMNRGSSLRMCSNAYKFVFSLDSRVLVIEQFNSNGKSFLAETLTVKSETSLLLNALLHVHPLTSIN